MNFWLILTLVVLPFLHCNLKIAPVETAHILGIIVLGISITGAKIFQKNKLLGIGTFFLLASYLILWNTPLVRDAFQTIVFFLLWSVFYLSVREEKINPKLLLQAIAIAGYINAIYLIFQAFGNDFVFAHLGMEPTYPVYGFLGSKGDSGVFQAVSLPVALSLNWVCGIIVFIGLLLTRSTVAITAGIVGTSFYLLSKYRNLRKFVLIIPVILIFLVFLLDKPKKIDFDVRLTNIKETINFIKKGEMKAFSLIVREKIAYSIHKIKYTPFGYGLGSFKSTVPFLFDTPVNYLNSRCNHPHNDFIWLLFEMGVFAPIILLGIIIFALLKNTNPAIRGGILSASIASLGYFTFLIPMVMIQISVLLGINDRK